MTGMTFKHCVAILFSMAISACGGGDSSSVATVSTPAPGASSSVIPPVAVVSPPAPDGTKTEPPQIAFLMEILPLASNSTIYRVRGNPPLACLANTAQGCVTPASVEVYLGADLIVKLEKSNNGTRTTPSYPTYDGFVPSVVSGAQVFRAVVTLPADASGAVYRREGVLLYDTGATNDRQVTIAGPGTTQQLAVIGGRADDSKSRVGDTIVVAATSPGLDPASPGVVRLLEKPADSRASLPASAPRGTVSFVADRIGRYTVEYSPILADGQRGPPVYTVVQVEPQYLRISADFAGLSGIDKPPASAGATRLYVSPTSTRGIASVQVLLDGVSLGSLVQPNVQRADHVCSRGAPCVIAYTWAFDFSTSAVANGSHLLRVFVTDVVGHTFELPVPLPGNGGASQEFTDTNP